MPLQKGSAFPHFLLVICLCRMKEAYMAKMPMLRSLNCFSESKYNNQDIIRNRFTIYLQVSKKNYFLSSWEHCNKSFSPGNKSGEVRPLLKVQGNSCGMCQHHCPHTWPNTASFLISNYIPLFSSHTPLSVSTVWPTASTQLLRV